MYDIFYSDGGHFGPIKDFDLAIGQCCVIVNAIQKDGLYADIRPFGDFNHLAARIYRSLEGHLKVHIYPPEIF